MKSVFDILREKLNKEKSSNPSLTEQAEYWRNGIDSAIKIVNQVEEEYQAYMQEPKKHTWFLTTKSTLGLDLGNNGWIPCSERMPEVETEVLIFAKRKWKDGTFKNIITTAMYEDGTVLENDSIWRWEDIEGEWDEENDCYIILEGWWEWKHYNGDSELNHAVDDEVIAWQPLPESYKPNICATEECPYHTETECPAWNGCGGYQSKGE